MRKNLVDTTTQYETVEINGVFYDRVYERRLTRWNLFLWCVEDVLQELADCWFELVCLIAVGAFMFWKLW